MSEEIPIAVQNLIRNRIGSIAHLELLLRLHSEPARSWSPAEAAQVLYAPITMTDALLVALQAEGLAARLAESDVPRFHYSPRNEELAEAVNELARLYPERRFTLIGMIYSGSTKTLQDFADAFRIRRKEE